MGGGGRVIWRAAQAARRSASYHVKIAMAEARLRWDGSHPFPQARGASSYRAISS